MAPGQLDSKESVWKPGMEAKGFQGSEEGRWEGEVPDDRLPLDLASGGVGGPLGADGAAHHHHVHRDDCWRQVSHLHTHTSPQSLSPPAATASPRRLTPSSSQPRVSTCDHSFPSLMAFALLRPLG